MAGDSAGSWPSGLATRFLFWKKNQRGHGEVGPAAAVLPLSTPGIASRREELEQKDWPCPAEVSPAERGAHSDGSNAVVAASSWVGLRPMKEQNHLSLQDNML